MSYSKYRKNNYWTFKIIRGYLGHRMQEGIVVYMLLAGGIIGYTTLNLAYLLLQDKGNTYENRRVLPNYERP